ncbi:LytR/AlgR family response regulator transcription factor [endosymbiont of Ridgeia piscesae]|jgi:two-component system response regulator AlgR|uniref:Two component transcriptional regulator, LytTR family n=1 Tax=endosymbiont of Ridgeia piscesae TaxID=54398 RepID=A0A0T5YZY4_9GAMM|nr:LytTR family DNA-binding domain-containing protein [endosymbiont of Ridgeia piscesae]KRT56162.1 two component transcriptional regulator, LytTR family [endosymbiont of Ridgeia piscesae]KRT59990.1 two component transcriptional regulator, LytTR family [endosymbiont of Ridgeia piscesae]
MNILLVDDEPLARERLTALLVELGGDYRVVAMAANGEQALQLCDELQVDLLLLDIRMPGIDGLTVAARLAEMATPPAVIFTTAYDEHALQAFEQNAVGYLLKPVRKQRLQQALEQAQRLTRPQLVALSVVQASSAPPLRSSYRGGLETLPIEAVIYLKAEAKYVVARHAGGELLLEESLKSLEGRYPEQLLRIHRNALVARQRLVALERGTNGGAWVRLQGCEERLEASRRHLPEIRRWLSR